MYHPQSDMFRIFGRDVGQILFETVDVVVEMEYVGAVSVAQWQFKLHALVEIDKVQRINVKQLLPKGVERYSAGAPKQPVHASVESVRAAFPPRAQAAGRGVPLVDGGVETVVLQIDTER